MLVVRCSARPLESLSKLPGETNLMNFSPTVLVAALVALVHPGSASYAGLPGDGCTTDIDYARVAVNPRPGHSITFGTVSSGDDIASSAFPPFSVDLIRVDKPDYAINEGFVFTLRIVNTSRARASMPVSGRPIYKVNDEYLTGYRHVHIEFVLHESGHAEAVVDRYTLYGATDVAGSLLELDPGECAVVHIPGYIQIYNLARRSAMLERAVTAASVTVNLHLFDPRDTLYRRSTASSVSNGIDVRVRGEEMRIIERETQ